MPQYKFGENDVYHNIIKAHPRYRQNWYFNLSYINGAVHGANVNSGKVSLYEMNIDRDEGFIAGVIDRGENFQEVSFTKNNRLTNQKEVSQGAGFTSSYPLTSSIVREILIAQKAGGVINGIEHRQNVTNADTVFKLIALKNIYDHYRPMSKHFDFDKYILASGGLPAQLSDQTTKDSSDWPDDAIAATVTTSSIPKSDFTNLIIIPSIFYGSAVKRGSLDLKFYYTGSLVARAQDIKQNGELIETTGSSRVGQVIGTVLYNEGVIVITASHNLHDKHDGYLSPSSSTDITPVTALQRPGMVATSSWVHFGAYQSYVTDKDDATLARYAPVSSSYSLEFRGTNEVPVMTMLAHAGKNDLNWSNNPTFIEHNGPEIRRNENPGDTYATRFVKQTGSNVYKERDRIAIKNTVSGAHPHHSESFHSQTFISKIAIYDDNKELIGMAKLANPIKKTNERDYTFKLKLDL